METREAQEANLLNLYTAALKHIAASNFAGAKQNLHEIIGSPIFQVRGTDVRFITTYYTFLRKRAFKKKTFCKCYSVCKQKIIHFLRKKKIHFINKKNIHFVKKKNTFCKQTKNIHFVFKKFYIL